MEINYFYLFKKYKKFFIPFVLTVTVVALIIVYRQSPLYRATAEIYISDSGSLNLVYAALETKEIQDRIINQFNLIEVFQAANLSQARKYLLNISQNVLDSRAKLIEIRVWWKDPVLSAQIANAFVEELYKSFPTPAPTHLSSKRLQYGLLLEDAERKLAEIQNRKSKNLSIDDNLKRIIKQIAGLRANISWGDRILLDQIVTSTIITNLYVEVFKDIKSNQAQLKVVSEELSNYIRQIGFGGEDLRSYFRAREMKSYLAELEEAEFDVAVHKRIFDEMKVREASDRPLGLRVVERATPPSEPLGPSKISKVALSVLLGTVTAAFLSILLENSNNQRLKEFFSSPGSKGER